jgi:alkylation response protein AidB-like acyl-CoA dehydrogenase
MQALTVLDEEESMFRDTVRRFAKERIAPHARPMDEAGVFRKELLRELFDAGLMGIEIPEEHGGQEGTFFQSVTAIEEIAAVDPSTAVVVDVQNTLVVNAVMRWASDDQKRRYLLNGRKLWITNAAEAGLFLVFANVNPEAGYRGITCFLVERGFEGFQVGKKEDKLGIRSSSTCELILDNCRVPKSNVVGEIGKGYKIIMRWRTQKSESSSGKPSVSFRACSFNSLKWRRSRRRRVCWSTMRRVCATPENRSLRKPRWLSTMPRRSRNKWLQPPWKCLEALVLRVIIR